MTVTAASVAAWGRFETPTGTELDLLEQVIAATTARLSREYFISSPPTDDDELAIKLVAVRLWARRNTPEGRNAFGGDIAVTITADDADAVALLMPRPGFA